MKVFQWAAENIYIVKGQKFIWNPNSHNALVEEFENHKKKSVLSLVIWIYNTDVESVNVLSVSNHR